MTKNMKSGVVSLLGGIGVIVLLIGIFTNAYSFNVGFISAIAIWIITGAVSKIIGVKKN